MMKKWKQRTWKCDKRKSHISSELHVTYICSLYMCSLYMCSLYICSLYMCSLYIWLRQTSFNKINQITNNINLQETVMQNVRFLYGNVCWLYKSIIGSLFNVMPVQCERKYMNYTFTLRTYAFNLGTGKKWKVRGLPTVYITY